MITISCTIFTMFISFFPPSPLSCILIYVSTIFVYNKFVPICPYHAKRIFFSVRTAVYTNNFSVRPELSFFLSIYLAVPVDFVLIFCQRCMQGGYGGSSPCTNSCVSPTVLYISIYPLLYIVSLVILIFFL